MESKAERLTQCFVKNICLSDAVTGFIICQRVYKWKESSAFLNLGSLIQVFYQFAREVDDGQISCVNFESGRKANTRLGQDEYQPRNQTMQMKSIKTEDIYVSVFFDMQVLIHTVRAAFERDHLHILVEKRVSGQLQREIEQMQEEGEQDERVGLPFDAFGGVVDKLQGQLFPQYPAVDVLLSAALSLEEHVTLQLAQLG
mmetsp:Transcript_27635/g.61190  ORF Transcript_27635/g.61190 Transcript_27635/m.61190 type:complete len:200 (-) Transcript_27635:111-710(-)